MLENPPPQASGSFSRKNGEHKDEFDIKDEG
jgi:hypothetical protein